jgi:uncharacterized protein YjiS (DUF1127 family)
MTNIKADDFVTMMLVRKGATFVRLDSRTTPAMLKTNNPFYDKATKTFNVVKDSSTNAMIGVNYKNLVNNARNREALDEVTESLMSCLGLSKTDAKAYLESLLETAGDMVETNPKAFEPKERKWGKHMQVIDIDGEKVFKQDKDGIYLFDENGHIIPVLSKTMVDHVDKGGNYNRYMQIMVIKSSTPVYRYADSLDEVSEKDLIEIKSLLTKKSSNAAHQGLKKEIPIRGYKVQNIRTLRLNKTEYVVRDDAVVVLTDTKTPVSSLTR